MCHMYCNAVHIVYMEPTLSYTIILMTRELDIGCIFMAHMLALDITCITLAVSSTDPFPDSNNLRNHPFSLGTSAAQKKMCMYLNQCYCNGKQN